MVKNAMNGELVQIARVENNILNEMEFIGVSSLSYHT